MKKLISFALVLALALSLSVAVSAADITTDGGTAQADVTVAVVGADGEAVTMENVCSVTVTFAELAFEYTADIAAGEKLTWDPATHTYKNESNEAVTYTAPEAISNAIKADNHSNVKLSVTASFAENQTGVNTATVNGVTATISANDDTILESAAVVAYNNVSAAPSATFTLTPSGQPEILKTFNNTFTVGTITVAISVV